jgi:hypothetical protein
MKTIAIVLSACLLGAACGGSGGGSAKTNPADFCKNVNALKLASAAASNADPAKISAEVKVFDRVRASAPDELKNDGKFVSNELHSVDDALRKAGNDPRKQMGALFAAAFTVDHKKLDLAGKHFAQVAKAKCGIVIDLNKSGREDNASVGGSGGASVTLNDLDTVLDSPAYQSLGARGSTSEVFGKTTIEAVSTKLDPATAVTLCNALDPVVFAKAPTATLKIETDFNGKLLAQATHQGGCAAA